MPFVPAEPWFEEADGELIGTTGFISTFLDRPDTPPPERRHPFGFGLTAGSHNASARTRHRSTVPSRTPNPHA